MPKNSLIIDDIDEFEEFDDDLGVPTNTSSSELRATTTTEPVLMDELFNSSTGKFKSEKVENLFRTITKHSLLDNGFEEYLESQGGSMNAADFRANAGQDVRVTLFGLTWYPMYISRAYSTVGNSDGSGELIDYEVSLTLWLDNYAQDYFTDSSFGGNYISSNATGFCCYDGFEYWVPDKGNFHADMEFDSENVDETITNNMYYLSRVVQSDTYCKSERVQRAILSATGVSSMGTLLYYMYSPKLMPYQEYQSAKEILGLPYNLQNEAWSEDLSDDGFYSPEYNTYSYIYRLITFLPSLSEIGYSGVSGLWGASPAQRACYATASENMYTRISGTTHQLANNTLTRSGNYKQSYGYYFVKSSGEGKGIGASCARVYRPCINLTLTTVYDPFLWE